MNYQSIRPFMSRKHALEIGFTPEELDSEYPPIITDVSQFDEKELELFRKMLKERPGMPELVPYAVREILKNT